MVILALRWVGVGLRGVVVMGFGLNSGLMWNHPPPPPPDLSLQAAEFGAEVKEGASQRGRSPLSESLQ